MAVGLTVHLESAKMTQEQGMTYASVGVDYDSMDPFKRVAQQFARQTHENGAFHDFRILDWTMGESVVVSQDMRTHRYRGQVIEGLGTKNLVADALAQRLGMHVSYSSIAKDTLAMILNDMITLGLNPEKVSMHLSVGESEWFSDEERAVSLLAGWRDACNEARVVWSGGETPTLRGIIMPGTCELSGCADGSSWELFDPKTTVAGDHIIGFASSGIHANGLTLARQLALQVSDDYLAKLPSGRTFGDALLEPTHLYVQAVRYIKDVLGAKVRYGVNVTGHGWRKLMRLNRPLRYVMDYEVPVPEVLAFIQKEAGLSNESAYDTFNMGLGFALFVDPADSARILQDQTLKSFPFATFLAGRIESASDKSVEIPWCDVSFDSSAMSIR